MYIQAPVLRERRNELRRQETIFAVDSIQGVQLAVARNHEDGHLSKSAGILGDGRRIVETGGTQPVRLLLGLAFHGEFLLPEKFARVGINRVEVVRTPGDNQYVLHATRGVD